MRITKIAVDKLVSPSTLSDGKASSKCIYDDSLKGFGLRITSSGIKSFIIEKRVNGKMRRITLGRYPSLTVEMARKEAQKLLGKMATGIDPVAEKKEEKAREITLSQAFQDYLKARKSLKPATVFDYQRVMKEGFPDWQRKPLLNITKDMIAKRHVKIGETSKARANLSMRVLRAIFNFAAGEYEDANGQSLILENPVKRLSHTRAWYRVARKTSVLKPQELADWYQGVIQLQDQRSSGRSAIVQDYLLFILFTGLRRTEAAKLKWEQVNFTHQTFTVTDTKNHQDHTLPLSDFVLELLERRKAAATNDYVFPGSGKEGYIIEPRKVMAKVTQHSGLQFTLHDLRRTFITTAESLDIPAYALKKLLNHKTTGDVTAGYIVMDVERLRKPMQMITDYFTKVMKIAHSKILTINKRKAKND